MLKQEEQFKTISVSTFKNVATHKTMLLSRLGLNNVHDLIFNLPFRYEDRTYVQPMCDLLNEQVILSHPCTVICTIISDNPESNPKTTIFQAQDISGTSFDITFFKCPDFLLGMLLEYSWFIVYGKVTLNTYSDRLCMVHPEIVPLKNDEFALPSRLTPIYHLTKGIRQESMFHIEDKALQLLAAHPIDELIPPQLNPFKLTLTEALLLTHNPPPMATHECITLEGLESFRRICFEELVAYKIAMLKLHARQDTKLVQAIPFNDAAHRSFLESLPFEPTRAQSNAFSEILADCDGTHAMSRILNGDVGSGKTLVAAMCMMQCAAAGKQSVLMAPTEILAQQHYQKLAQLFAPFGFGVGLLTGSLKRAEKQELLQKCASGEMQIIIGTHAVFQKSVKYHSLALVIIDEQHRFGVSERESLLDKAPEGYAANELLMTATPIPRSLRMAMFNETKVSILNEMPKGRLPIHTSLLERAHYNKLIERLYAQCKQGEQAYWICPYVEDLENSSVSSVKARQKDLQDKMPMLSIGLIHGKMSEKEKNTVMADFASGKHQILVATVIVEVGVDVPNASIIIIEDPQTMGLSQLHQLRGRVGRGTKQSFCLLLYRKDELNKNKNISRQTKKRQEVKTERAIGLELANQSRDAVPYTGYDPYQNTSQPNQGSNMGGWEQTPQSGDNSNQMNIQSPDMMDWNSDPELTFKLQEILRDSNPISMKRLKILECTNNGFAIASQDLILRGPGEFFGQNQTGNESFRYADLIRDYRMLKTVNQVAEWMYHNSKPNANALIRRWYAEFDELEKLKRQSEQPETAEPMPTEPASAPSAVDSHAAAAAADAVATDAANADAASADNTDADDDVVDLTAMLTPEILDEEPAPAAAPDTKPEAPAANSTEPQAAVDSPSKPELEPATEPEPAPAPAMPDASATESTAEETAADASVEAAQSEPETKAETEAESANADLPVSETQQTESSEESLAAAHSEPSPAEATADESAAAQTESPESETQVTETQESETQEPTADTTDLESHGEAASSDQNPEGESQHPDSAQTTETGEASAAAPEPEAETENAPAADAPAKEAADAAEPTEDTKPVESEGQETSGEATAQPENTETAPESTDTPAPAETGAESDTAKAELDPESKPELEVAELTGEGDGGENSTAAETTADTAASSAAEPAAPTEPAPAESPEVAEQSSEAVESSGEAKAEADAAAEADGSADADGAADGSADAGAGTEAQTEGSTESKAEAKVESKLEMVDIEFEEVGSPAVESVESVETSDQSGSSTESDDDDDIADLTTVCEPEILDVEPPSFVVVSGETVATAEASAETETKPEVAAVEAAAVEAAATEAAADTEAQADSSAESKVDLASGTQSNLPADFSDLAESGAETAAKLQSAGIISPAPLDLNTQDTLSKGSEDLCDSELELRAALAKATKAKGKSKGKNKGKGKGRHR